MITIDDPKLEKEVGGMTVISEVIHHNRRSLLRGHYGKQHSQDMVGSEIRSQLEESVAKHNPFSRRREKVDFFDKSRGGAFAGLKEEDLVKFIDSKKKEFQRKSR